MRILGPALVARYAGRMLNIHPSLLPFLPRAAHPPPRAGRRRAHPRLHRAFRHGATSTTARSSRRARFPSSTATTRTRSPRACWQSSTGCCRPRCARSARAGSSSWGAGCALPVRSISGTDARSALAPRLRTLPRRPIGNRMSPTLSAAPSAPAATRAALRGSSPGRRAWPRRRARDYRSPCTSRCRSGRSRLRALPDAVAAAGDDHRAAAAAEARCRGAGEAAAKPRRATAPPAPARRCGTGAGRRSRRRKRPATEPTPTPSPRGRSRCRRPSSRRRRTRRTRTAGEDAAAARRPRLQGVPRHPGFPDRRGDLPLRARGERVPDFDHRRGQGARRAVRAGPGQAREPRLHHRVGAAAARVHGRARQPRAAREPPPSTGRPASSRCTSRRPRRSSCRPSIRSP